MPPRASGLVPCLVLLLAALPASADRGAKRDGDNTAGPLDIARIVHKHREGSGNVFVHKIVMQRAWKSSVLKNGNRAERSIKVTFDVRQNAGYECVGCITEREAVIDFNDGRLTATLYNHLGDPPKKLRQLAVWRPHPRTVAFAVRRKHLRRTQYSFYEWGVKTSYSKRGHDSCPPRNTCVDIAPNRDHGLLKHRV